MKICVLNLQVNLLNNNIGEADLKLLKEIYHDNWDLVLEKLKEHYPIQYLIGYVDFYNLKINVNENVLIPRFETELLVEKAINFLKTKNYHNILDIGTGSGCIAIALKKNLKIEVDALDISDGALLLAKKNSEENNTAINFFKMDILKEIPKKKYDCLISNPPYVKKGELVSPETKYEPQIALYAENEGLAFYERIISRASNMLNRQGSIILEIGDREALYIKNMVLKYFPNASIRIEKDYNDLDRFMFIET